jgi:hypothetical protein
MSIETTQELQASYMSPNIITIIKARKLRWAEHVACVGEMRNACKISVGNLNGRHQLGDERVKKKIFRIPLRTCQLPHL